MKIFLRYPAAIANAYREAVIRCAKTGLDPLTGGSLNFSKELVENKYRLSHVPSDCGPKCDLFYRLN